MGAPPCFIVFAPGKAVDGLGGWENFPDGLPSIASDKIVAALATCPILKREGSTFRGDELDEFTVEPGTVQFIELEESRQVWHVCSHLAQTLGIVTLIRESFDDWVEFGPGGEEKWSEPENEEEPPRLATCPLCGRRFPPRSQLCLYCGRSPGSEAQVSLEPHPAAPGRPEPESATEALSRLYRWWWISVVLAIPVAVVWVWLAPRSDKDLRRQTRFVLISAYMHVKSGGQIEKDGRVNAGSGWKEPDFTTIGADGKTCVCDAWKNPVRFVAGGSYMRLYSFGPDGKDDAGKGDDIVMDAPDF